MGDEIEGAMQHAAHPGRQFMDCIVIARGKEKPCFNLVRDDSGIWA